MGAFQGTEQFAGGTLVVTGAGSGIGEAVARRGASLGMRVVASDVDRERAEQVADSLRDQGAEVLSVVADVRDFESVRALSDAAYERFGQVRMLVNNAGIESTGFLWEMSPERWRAMVDVNLSGVFHGVRAFLPRLLEQDGPAAIVNLSSIGGISTGPLQAAYIATKHAVQALSECLAMEIQLTGAPISVHVVNPGPVSTRIFVDGKAEGNAGTAPLSEMATYLREQGISPAQAAEAIFAGVARDDFWLVTHHAMQDQVARRRAGMLVERTRPQALSAEECASR